MRISLASDIHLEFYGKNEWIPNHTDMDILILAGDIHTGYQALPWIAKHFAHVPHILYVLGNHEFYGSNYAVTKHYRKMQEKADLHGLKNLTVLQNKFVDINGVRFLGATLWTDYRLGGNQPLNMFNAQNQMNDYKHIRYYTSRVKTTDLLKENAESKQFLFSNLSDSKNVVITHHQPVFFSNNDDRIGDLVSCYYNTLDNDICYSEKPIDYWFAGHTHGDDIDQVIGNTHIVSNMHGYVFSRKTPFVFKDFEL